MPTNKRDLFYTVKEKQIPRFARDDKKAGADKKAGSDNRTGSDGKAGSGGKAGSDNKAGSDSALNDVLPRVAIVFG